MVGLLLKYFVDLHWFALSKEMTSIVYSSFDCKYLSFHIYLWFGNWIIRMQKKYRREIDLFGRYTSAGDDIFHENWWGLGRTFFHRARHINRKQAEFLTEKLNKIEINYFMSHFDSSSLNLREPRSPFEVIDNWPNWNVIQEY